MRKFLVLAALVAAVLFAQSTVGPLLPVWTGQRYLFAKLGPGLTLSGEVLSAKAPARIYAHRPIPTPGGAFSLPPGARNPAVWLNGLRQAPGVDYEATAGEIRPLWPWPADSIVLIDYDAE